MDELTVYTFEDQNRQEVGGSMIGHAAARRFAQEHRLRLIGTDYVRTTQPELLETFTPQTREERGT